VLLFDAPLTFREFMTHEELPLATVFREVLTWLGGRPDAVLFGAQAVNAWCEPPRMTADVDVVSTNARGFGEDLREHLASKFHIAVRVRQIGDGAFRVYQLRKPKNRHLVDVRQVAELPEFRTVEGARVAVPSELVARKVLSMVERGGKEKGISDRLDVHRLLNTFADLREDDGVVASRLQSLGAGEAALALWRTLIQERFEPDAEDVD
jgi:hypothetical protein